MTIVPLALAVNRLASTNKVERRLASEAGLFGEVRELRKRHHAETKYALALLHKHFDLAEDEVLIEYTDIEKSHPDHEAGASRRSPGDQRRRDDMVDRDQELMTACAQVCYYYPGLGTHDN